MAKKAYIGVEKTTYLNSLGDVAVGSTVKINENGSPVDYLVVHHGNPDPKLYDASCDGTWVLRKDVQSIVKWSPIGSGVNNDYQNSDVHKYLNETVLGLFDANVQTAIKQVKIPYVNGTGYTGSLATGVNGLSTKLFALGAYEVGFGRDSTFFDDGVCLSYFVNSTNTTRIAYLDGVTTLWWIRTPYKGHAGNTFGVHTSGGLAQGSSSTDMGVRPAFILPSSLSLTDGTVTGAQAESTTQSVARKVKKGYVGVVGKARKIKKAYIGIGGVARPCWSGGELAYYGTITPLSVARRSGASATVGNYALFAGGHPVSNVAYDVIDAYDNSLTRSTPTTLSNNKAKLSGASTGTYAVFGGGQTTPATTSYFVKSATAEAFDSSLTKHSMTNLNAASGTNGATSVHGYVFFAGGVDNGITDVTVYDSSLTKVSSPSLSRGRYALASAAIGDYALFGGGWSDETAVEAFDTSVTRKTLTGLSVGRAYLAATTVGNYALFGGGYDNNSYYATVDAYNPSLTRSVPTALEQKAHSPAATTVGDFALFGGGQGNWQSATRHATMNVYDTSLTKTTGTSLSTGRYEHAATTVGNYALFAGGYGSSNPVDVVDAYVVD